MGHLLYTSITSPYPHPKHAVQNEHFWTEARLFATKGGWTALRDNVYADLHLWDLERVTAAGKIFHATGNGGRAIVTREVDEGLETLEIDLPGVVTTDLRLNQPRYVKLPDILKAKRKPLDVIELGTVGVDTTPQFRVVHTAAPSPRPRGVLVRDVTELLAQLRRRGVL